MDGMTIDIKQCTSGAVVSGALGLAGKTITSVATFKHGSVEVVDILCTDTVHYFIKSRFGQVEIGGTGDWGTGTLVGGR